MKQLEEEEKTQNKIKFTSLSRLKYKIVNTPHVKKIALSDIKLKEKYINF